MNLCIVQKCGMDKDCNFEVIDVNEVNGFQNIVGIVLGLWI